jgi:hypothetical protein
MQRPKVFFKIAINGQPQGVVVFEVCFLLSSKFIAFFCLIFSYFRILCQKQQVNDYRLLYRKTRNFRSLQKISGNYVQVHQDLVFVVVHFIESSRNLWFKVVILIYKMAQEVLFISELFFSMYNYLNRSKYLW